MVFDSIAENTDFRDNVFNDEVNDGDVFGNMSTEDANSIALAAGGIGFNADGAIIGEDGKVIYDTTALRGHIKDYYNGLQQPEFIEPAEGDQLELDGVVLTINTNGEAVNEQGEVVKTKDEVIALAKENAPTEPQGIEEVAAAANAQLGIEFKDDNGDVIDFDLTTVEGMQARDQYLIENIANGMANDIVKQSIGSDPDLEALYHHKRQHGTADGWTPTVDYSKVVLPEAGAEGADDVYKDLIIKGLVADGTPTETAKQMAGYLMDDGKGEEMAKSSLIKLQAADDLRMSKARAKEAADIEAANKARDDHWNSVRATINKGTVNGVTIPQFLKVKQEDGSYRMVPRASLFDYMSKPVDNGRSAWQVNKASRTIEDDVVDAMMSFTNNNHADVVKASVSDNKVKFIRKTSSVNSKNNKVNNPSGKAAKDRVILS